MRTNADQRQRLPRHSRGSGLNMIGTNFRPVTKARHSLLTTPSGAHLRVTTPSVGEGQGGGARSARAGLALYTLGLALLATPAHADLRLCNTTSGRIGVAIGYKDASVAGWATEGWWNIAAKTCETIYKGALSGRYYYIHAVDYDRGGEWGGQTFMCTADKTFTIKGVQDCPKRGYSRTGFYEVDTGVDAKDWTIRLTEPGEGGKVK